MRIFLSIFLLFNLNVYAQGDYSWWNEKHNWDGITSWHQYLKMSTSYLGPNALPVPEISNGDIDSSAEFEVAVSYHHSTGDKTKDIYLRGFLPLFDHRVAVSVDVIPHEWFETDTITRDRRAARTRRGEGGSSGDIYFHALFQLLRNHQHLPDILFKASIKTASGSNLGDARYTDSPGYSFDVSAGKNYPVGKNVLRGYIMAGFYAYQTYDIRNLQNDCFLYGLGLDFRSGKILLSQSLGGYNGYLNLGDKPMVYRASLRLLNKKIDWKFSYQLGLRDYDFSRYRVGVVVHLNQNN